MMVRYQETVLAPWWFRGAIWLTVLGLLAALVVPALAGAEIEEPQIYFPSLALGLVVILAVARSFTAIHIRVGLDKLEFGFAWLRRSVPLSAIREVKVLQYNWWTYGGWGMRISLGGRWAYSLPGVPQGIEVTVEHRGKLRRYFISSREPGRLAQALGSLASRVNDPSLRPGGSPLAFLGR